MNEEVARQYFYSCVPVQEHGAPLEQPQHHNHSSGTPTSEAPAISRRNFAPGQERPGRGQYVIEPDGRFLDMAAIREHVDRRSILAARREVIVELKITYANHYYARQGRGVELTGLCRYCVGTMSGVMSGPRASQGDVVCLRKGHLDPAWPTRGS